MAKIYWSVFSKPEEWSTVESYYFPRASWFAKRPWGMKLIKIYMSICWLFKGQDGN